MTLLPALLMVLLLLTSSPSPGAASFACTGTSTCKSAMGYIVPNVTTYADLYGRFNTSTLQELLDANNLTAPQQAIPAQTTVIIPFTCRCAGNGVGQSDQKPIYTVIDGDNLTHIALHNFGGFVTYQEIQSANPDQLPNANLIHPGEKLWIPLPCSCVKVDGSDVVHFAYSVGRGENASQIATRYGVSESTLVSVNNIADGENLQMGQILDVPRPQGAPSPPSPGPGAPLPPSPGVGPPPLPKPDPGTKPLDRILGSSMLISSLSYIDIEPTPQTNPGPGLVAVITGVVLIIAVLVWFSLSWYRWKCTRDSFARGIDGLKRFDYSILAVATDNFSEEKKLGEGAFGAVYRGSLTDDNGREQKVAVKKIKDTTEKNKGFLAELKATSATRHINLVSLKGWGCSATMTDVMCWSRLQNVKLFLVYELVSNHDLDYHLHRSGKVLPWTTRYQIVKGIVSALHYLHHETQEYILHRDIKPSNILLDEGFNPKLADFGLARIASHNNTTLPTQAIGSEGYIDPQCRKDGQVKFHRESDVYSFGIVLLDIACTDKSRNEVWELFGRSTEPQVEAAEAQVETAADAKLCGVFDRKQMRRVVSLGLRCSNPDGAERPSMRDAMIFLEQDTE